jgi:signal transduction histidine kinase
LAVPVDRIEPGEVHFHETTGPAGARLMITERRISLMVGGQLVPIRAIVGIDLARVSAAGIAFAKDLIVALVILGIVLALATSVQVFLGLRPLDALRLGIADIRSGRSRRLPPAVPIEVLPLVEEVNALLDAQDLEIERSRGRAADLAHGLKTPLAALAADAGRLRERGETKLARDIQAVGDAMSRHVDRELARVRLRGAVKRGVQSSTTLAPLALSLVSILSRTPAGERITFNARIADDVTIPLDRTDLSEVLGNLLDNATRHAASQVRISAENGSLGPYLAVEDDGEGVAPAARGAVLGRGIRLDERGGEAGLGLAIVQDVLDAYGWSLQLESSELGGLSAICRPAHK